jgi:putative ABC transport system ATP-binding protein
MSPSAFRPAAVLPLDRLMAAKATGVLLAGRDLGRRHPTAEDWLFRQVELEVGHGDRLALVGPTGAGKSLILRALALLDPLDQGEVLWQGEPIADHAIPTFRGQVLYLQQRSPVVEGSVEDNLRLPFRLQVRKVATYPAERARHLVTSLGRDPSFLQAHTVNLSGGERQMVALLRALLVDPQVLLLDEPSAALDPETTAVVESLVDTWYREAPTARACLWVSHDQDQARRVADRILEVRDGRLERTE